MPSLVYSGAVEDLPRESKFKGFYERTGLCMDSANMCFVWLTPDALADVQGKDGYSTIHSHAMDMFVYVLEGELDFTAGDKVHHLKKGHFIYVPGGVPHGGMPANDKPVQLLEIFAPIRTDYLYVAEHQLSHTEAPRNTDGSRTDERTVYDIISAENAQVKLHN